MNAFLIRIQRPALSSLVLIAPFIIMEVVNTNELDAVLNIPLWGILWLLPTLFITILQSVVQNRRPGNGILANRASLWLRVAFLIPVAWLWTAVVIDQMPCFLGVPNCD